MNFGPRSLRQKIVLGYIVGFTLVLGVSFLNLRNLQRTEDMVIAGETVSNLMDMALEMRRFEKNYFLYGKDDDRLTLMSYVKEAESLLEKQGSSMLLFTSASAVSEMKAALAKYRLLWGGSRDPSRREHEIRLAGRNIVTAAEDVNRSKSRIKQATLRLSRKTLILSISFLLSIIVVSGFAFYKMFVVPLASLEQHMMKIAEGEFSLLPIQSRDREIVSFNRAFNRMLVELEARQMRFIYQSEKLVSLGTMVSGVAHQLNNPLSNISTSCQIVMEELHSPDAEFKRELLAQIESQVERARNLIYSLLEFSRKKDVKAEPLALAPLIDDTIRLLRGNIPSRVAVRSDIPPEALIVADKQRIQQVFLNLINNAIDAMPGEGEITVLARDNAESRMTEISFQDTGTGIETENLQRIFNPFFTTKPEGEGSGLGLFVAREIVEEHGGTMEVKSAAGQGTTFTIHLPFREA